MEQASGQQQQQQQQKEIFKRYAAMYYSWRALGRIQNHESKQYMICVDEI